MSSRTPTQVDLPRLQQIVAAYGSRPSRWPEKERDSALVLLQSHPEIQSILEQESDLDAWLDLAPDLAPSANLHARVIAAALQPRASWVERVNRWAAGLWPIGHNLQPIGALAAAAILGLATGFLAPTSDAASSDAWDSEVLVIDDDIDDGDLP